MKAIETTATLTENGQLTLNEPLTLTHPHPSRVRVIVLISEEEELEDDSNEPSVKDSTKGGKKPLLEKPIPSLNCD